MKDIINGKFSIKDIVAKFVDALQELPGKVSCLWDKLYHKDMWGRGSRGDLSDEGDYQRQILHQGHCGKVCGRTPGVTRQGKMSIG